MTRGSTCLNPQEILEPAWPAQDPPFDRFTAMRIKRPPGAPEDSHIFDYFINMDNVFLVQATKTQAKRAQEFRDRFKFGMTLISLALIRHDIEAKKREEESPGTRTRTTSRSGRTSTTRWPK